MFKMKKWLIIGLVLISSGMAAQSWEISERNLIITKKGKKLHLTDISGYSFLKLKADTAFAIDEVLYYENNGLTGIISEDYQTILEARYNAITPTSSELYMFQEQNNFFFSHVNNYPDEENPLIQKVGEDFQEASLLHSYVGDHIFNFSGYSQDILDNEYYLVKKNSVYGVICPEVYPEQYIVEPGFESIELITSSLGSVYFVGNGNKWGAWVNGRLDVNVKYDSLELLKLQNQNNYYYSWLDGRKDLLISSLYMGDDMSGEVQAFEIEYDEIRPIQIDGNGIICFLREGEKWGIGSYIAGDGVGRKMIAELMYDDIKFLSGSPWNSCYVAWKDANAVFISTVDSWGETFYQADEVLKFSHVDDEGMYVFKYDIQDSHTYQVSQKEIQLIKDDYLNLGITLQ